MQFRNKYYLTYYTYLKGCWIYLFPTYIKATSKGPAVELIKNFKTSWILAASHATYYDRSVSNWAKINFLSPNSWVKKYHFWVFSDFLWYYASYSMQILGFQKIGNIFAVFYFLLISKNWTIWQTKNPQFSRNQKVLSGYVRVHQNRQEKCRKGYFEAKNTRILFFAPFETLLSFCAM